VASRNESGYGSNVVVRSLGWNLVTAGLWGFSGLLCVVWAANTSELAARVVFAAIAAGCGLMVLRTIVAGAEAGPHGVLVRGFFRARLVPWPAIVEIGPSNRGGSSCLALRLASGEIVPARGCAAYSNKKLREYAEAISGARPAGLPAPERATAASPREPQSAGRRAVRQLWFLVGLPLLAVPLGVILIAAFSYWPGVALSIGGVAVAAMNYRRLKTHRSRN
jgi:hypothetical protein